VSLVGVGQRPSLFGPDDEDPVTEVRGTNGGRWDAVPLRVIPALGQVSENFAHPPSSKEPWYVLHEHVGRSYQANESRELGPEPAFVIWP
jgi:hypothetical protein